MPPSGLIDTGAILAILEADDQWHAACLESLSSLRLPLLTTEAVLTETFHLASRNWRNIESAWRFVRSGALTVAEIGDGDLPLLHALMTRYADIEMDFADATLVHIGNRESVNVILTIDYNDFATYRLAGNKKFMVLPGRGRT